MGKLIKNGRCYTGGESVIYKNGIPYLSDGVPNYILGEKNITLNGIYDPNDDHFDGYSQIFVNVPTQDPPVLKTKSISSNGTYNASVDNADGFSQVTVNVNQSTETKNISSNGTYTPSSGKIGFSSVTVNVNQSTETKSISSNGTYTPSSGKIGFSSVTVNVPQSSRVLLWSGRTGDNISVNLSAYNWIYLVTAPSSAEHPQTGYALLHKDNNPYSVGISWYSSDWTYYGASALYRADNAGVYRITSTSGGDANVNITAIYGITNLS